MINILNEQARFFNICEITFINIDNIRISISVFGMKCSNHGFFLNRFCQHTVHINFINMNDEFLEIILHYLNKKRRVSFLKIFTEQISNK